MSAPLAAAGQIADAIAKHRVGGRPPQGRLRRLIWNLRGGRMQRTLAAATAASALPLGFEMYLEHYKGSFGDAWMWSPIITSPLLSLAAVAGFSSPRAARTA